MSNCFGTFDLEEIAAREARRIEWEQVDATPEGKALHEKEAAEALERRALRNQAIRDQKWADDHGEDYEGRET